VSLTGIFIYQEKFVYVNDAFCDIVGYTKEELLNMAPWETVTPKYQEKVKAITYKRINGKLCEAVHIQLEIQTKNGDVRFVKVAAATMHHKNRFAGTANVVDITEHIKLEEKLKKLATKDALTGIYNRYKTTMIIEEQIIRANRYNEIFSLIMFDIDHFKRVNDTYGHDVGDYVLQELSKTILQIIRKTDKLGRWGGEEFMLITPHTNQTEAFELAQKIRKGIENHPFQTVNHITISMGVTQYKNGDTLTIITKTVDDALYKAKENGRNQVVLF